MTVDSIESKVIEIISTQLSLREDDIRADARLIEDLSADSLDIVELVMEMEEVFDIEIPDNLVEQMKVVKDITDHVIKAASAE